MVLVIGVTSIAVVGTVIVSRDALGPELVTIYSLLEDVVATRRTDGQTCPLGVCSYVLETLDVVNLARN